MDLGSLHQFCIIMIFGKNVSIILNYYFGKIRNTYRNIVIQDGKKVSIFSDLFFEWWWRTVIWLIESCITFRIFLLIKFYVISFVRYNQTAIIDVNTGSLNETAYNEYGPVYLSVTFAAGYFYSFISFTAAISHVILFYGGEIWGRFKASRSEEVEDIHCKMMRSYEGIKLLIFNLTMNLILFYLFN